MTYALSISYFISPKQYQYFLFFLAKAFENICSRICVHLSWISPLFSRSNQISFTFVGTEIKEFVNSISDFFLRNMLTYGIYGIIERQNLINQGCFKWILKFNAIDFWNMHSFRSLPEYTSKKMHNNFFSKYIQAKKFLMYFFLLPSNLISYFYHTFTLWEFLSI